MEHQGPIKSIIISGNLQNDDLVYKLCPSTEFSEGVWNIAVIGISYSCDIRDVEELCEISCNIVKAQKYNNSFEVQSYNQPFAIFLLESKKSVIHFGSVIF